MVVKIDEKGFPFFAKRSSKRKSEDLHETVLEEKIEKLFIKKDPESVFQTFSEIGHGSYGKVFKSTITSMQQEVAVKVIEKFDRNAKSIINEIQSLKACIGANNIVQYLDSYLYNGTVWITMEYCSKGNLKTFISNGIPERHAIYIINQVLTGLIFLHNNNMIHRDIKSSNILLCDKGIVKIGDLGLCTNGKKSSLAGSVYWTAPEIIKRNEYDCKVDVWSLGALSYEIANNTPPYKKEGDLKAYFYTCTKGAPPLDQPKNWSLQYKEFLNLCFQMNPEMRPTSTELKGNLLFQNIESGSEFEKGFRNICLSRLMCSF